MATLWMDDVSVIPNTTVGRDGIEVWFFRFESSDPNSWTLIGKIPISAGSIPDTTPVVFRVRFVPTYFVPGEMISWQLRRIGPLNDSAYFLLSTNSAGGDPNGALYYWNGTSWVAETRDPWYRLLLPNSIIQNGIFEEVVRNPALLDFKAARDWGRSLIASRQAVIQQGILEILPGWNQLLESQVPLGKLRVHGLMSSGLRPERITYTWTENGLAIKIALGSIMPDIADLLAWFEHQLNKEVAA